MQCSCGSSNIKEHKVQKDKKVIAEFMSCASCGRVLWLYGEDKVKKD